ncbi:MAG: IS200/IS605 family transposase [Aridibacter famidurans]|nr:IS200/IS605 family transposase [Aridibacter famidurans]
MSHTNLVYHFVFATKGRIPFITDDLKPHLHRYLGGTVKRLGGTAYAVNGMREHVHLLVRLKTVHRLDYFVRDLKSNSSKWAKGRTNGRFQWQRRFGAFTVSRSQMAAVRRYIENQEKHHSRMSFREEYEEILRANGISTEYIWND